MHTITLSGSGLYPASRHCLPAVLPGLESKVSAVSAKFDPISSLDDEFYTYTGGKVTRYQVI